ncbi:MAG: hypothetical protein DCF25_14780 [Leptolyngbya foveolarum]|uniref:Uncharacterized protein n=1 Tax=Leptolyngbya foveolarum TaxID=47253 RepID=A0A2W4U5W8_9CYAN|nr:MAG: hypothetical protein DCF25_14780 [Leptolyngbya foveolarum]
MQSFESDMASGMSYELLAKHHKDFLIPWWSTEQLVANMRMLDDANIGPFANRERLLSPTDQ